MSKVVSILKFRNETRKQMRRENFCFKAKKAICISTYEKQSNKMELSEDRSFSRPIFFA